MERILRQENSKKEVQPSVTSRYLSDRRGGISLDLYNVLLKTFPDDPILHEFAGDAYFEKQMYQSAYEVYYRGISLNPNNKGVSSIQDLTHCDFCYICPYDLWNGKLIKGYRYRCTKCSDFDVCAKCFNLKPFPHQHSTQEFRSVPKDDWKLNLP
jgi:tetratricopeptide (TPR) repeat protein